MLATVFCVASLMTVPFAAHAESGGGGHIAPLEHTGWVPPKPKERSKAAGEAEYVAPLEHTGWIRPEPKEPNKAAGGTEYAALPPPELQNWMTPSFAPKKTLRGFRSHIEAGTITLRSSTPTNCLPGALKVVLADIAKRFGTVSISSTHRTPQRNRRVGGARKSLHLACRAIDFRVKARGRDVMAFLRNSKSVGGLKMYRNGVIHIDNGVRRTW